MRRNVGRSDRILRVALLAPALIVAAITVGLPSVGGVVLLVLAGVMVITGAVGFCPLYALFGIDTCPSQVARR